jgi:hypothetical protein
MSYATWPEHFTHTIGSEEILHVVHQRRLAFYRVGVPQLKKVYIFNGCTVSRMLIGRALTKLGFEAKPKKISGRTVVGRTCIKERGEEE